MKDWILELCPEIAEWQAEIIVDHVQKLLTLEKNKSGDTVWVDKQGGSSTQEEIDNIGWK